MRRYIYPLNMLVLAIVFTTISFNLKIPWLATSLVLLVASLLLLFLRIEHQEFDSRTIALLGVLCALAVASRQLVHAVGGASPVFFLIILYGYVFGARFGFMSGTLTIFISNLFLGHGPWSPFQMIALGGMGALAAYLPKNNKNQRVILAAYGVFAAYAFGAVTNLFFWLAFVNQQTLATYVGLWLAGAIFDTLRAASTAILLLLAGPTLINQFNRFQKRMSPIKVGKDG